MTNFDYLEADLSSCRLCEWRCKVDRLADNQLDNKNRNIEQSLGVCRNSLPLVASSQLHPATPASFDAFLTGCNFKCIFCQNWSISMFDQTSDVASSEIEGYYNPSTWAELGLAALASEHAEIIKADRLFFTGGEPTCSLPWIESVVQAAKALSPDVKVNFDTNGFMTKGALNRILEFTTSITFDLKAYSNDIFRALTGANVKPVLRNLKFIIQNAPDKLWEVRVMVIPQIHDEDVVDLCNFLANIDSNVKLNFLAFRPNFLMEDYLGATHQLLEHCVTVAQNHGLNNVSWSGQPDIEGRIPKNIEKKISELDLPRQIALPTAFATVNGCVNITRKCGGCEKRFGCKLKSYQPKSLH
jgi:pyruvate formate lyase activating enzyme